jgi:type I restriction enzyme, S subunit
VPTSGSWPERLVWREVGSGAKFRNGDTVFARITPCLENGKTAFIQCLANGEIAWGSTEFIVIRSLPPLPAAYSYLLARDPAFRTHAIQSMTGTSGRQRAQAEALARFRVVSPPEPVARAFAKLVEPTFEAIRDNCRQSETLTAVRDLLLPKLLSGEIRSKKAEEIVGEIA